MNKRAEYFWKAREQRLLTDRRTSQGLAGCSSTDSGRADVGLPHAVAGNPTRLVTALAGTDLHHVGIIPVLAWSLRKQDMITDSGITVCHRGSFSQM